MAWGRRACRGGSTPPRRSSRRLTVVRPAGRPGEDPRCTACGTRKALVSACSARDGQTRADIRASDDGSSAIQLAGVGDWGKGRPLVQLNILDGKPGLGLFTNNLKGPEFMTYAGRPDQATCLFTNEGKRWLTVGLDKSGEPDIQVFGKDGKAIFDLRKATGARSDNKR